MANVLIKIKLMLDSPDTDVDKVTKSCEKAISKFGKVGQTEVEPVAFGINALIFVVVADEARGGTEPLEEALSQVAGISSVEVLDVRRGLG